MPHPINKITDILGPGAMARPLQYTKLMNHSDGYKLGYCKGSLEVLRFYLEEIESARQTEVYPPPNPALRLAQETIERALILLCEPNHAC